MLNGRLAALPLYPTASLDLSPDLPLLTTLLRLSQCDAGMLADMERSVARAILEEKDTHSQRYQRYMN